MNKKMEAMISKDLGMNIDKIRKYIKENKGITFAFKFKGARNQIDEFI